MYAVGRFVWAIAEATVGPGHGHPTACLLNTTAQDAHIRVTVYFSNREPTGPYRLVVPARRTLHLRFNELHDPEPIPRDTAYSSVIRSDVPIVVQAWRPFPTSLS